ncbi:MAG: hypothetical protein WA769_18650 [Pseudolabrys sp.]
MAKSSSIVRSLRRQASAKRSTKQSVKIFFGPRGNENDQTLIEQSNKSAAAKALSSASIFKKGNVRLGQSGHSDSFRQCRFADLVKSLNKPGANVHRT